MPFIVIPRTVLFHPIPSVPTTMRITVTLMSHISQFSYLYRYLSSFFCFNFILSYSRTTKSTIEKVLFSFFTMSTVALFFWFGWSVWIANFQWILCFAFQIPQFFSCPLTLPILCLNLNVFRIVGSCLKYLVLHLITNRVRRCLTSKIERKPVFSVWFDRRRLRIVLNVSQ